MLCSFVFREIAERQILPLSAQRIKAVEPAWDNVIAVSNADITGLIPSRRCIHDIIHVHDQAGFPIRRAKTSDKAVTSKTHITDLLNT